MAKQSGSQTQEVKGWKPARQALIPAINDLSGRTFDEGGNLITGDTSMQRDALGSMYALSQNNPMQNAAMGYYSNILGGQTNPYLDQMFGKAADAVRSKLDSQFAAAGRYGSGDQAREIGQAYNDLATQMYGGQYNADQARMMQAAQLAPSAAYQGLNQQYKIGGELQDFDYNQALSRLQDYIGTISPLTGTSTTTNTPISRSPGAGALGGALGVAGLMGEKGLLAPLAGAGPLGIGAGLLGGALLGGL